MNDEPFNPSFHIFNLKDFCNQILPLPLLLYPRFVVSLELLRRNFKATFMVYECWATT